MTWIPPQLVVFFVLLQQRTHECLVFRGTDGLCAAGEVNGTLKTFCQIDKTALRRQFTAPTKVLRRCPSVN